MNLAKKLLMTTGTSSGTVPAPSGGYVDDVFSAYTYTGNGSTQTINNGIDLAGEGGLVWVKGRSGSTDHALYDTARGVTLDLVSNSTAGQITQSTGLTAFGNSGFSVGSLAKLNTNSSTYSSWTFRKAPKFFDVVTWTGDGTSNKTVSHSLGVMPGMVIYRDTGAAANWRVFTRKSDGSYTELYLNLTNAGADYTSGQAASMFSSSTINVGYIEANIEIGANANAHTYVAYLFAQDTSTDGIIQCGSFTGNTTVNIGWEPQWIMIKRIDVAGDWIVIDRMRGCSVGSADTVLYPDLPNPESASNDYVDFTATGFITKNPTGTHIYTVIRRPNKPPTSGTQVYSSSTANGVVSAGFPVDLHIGATRTGTSSNHAVHARLTGGARELVTSSTAEEAVITNSGFDSMVGLNVSLPSGTVNHFFRRAPGFLDVVCDTGTGAAHNITHNLTKVPELVIRKSRSAATQWEVRHSALAATEKLVLNSNAAKATDTSAWNSTLPTATQFTVGTGTNINSNTTTFVTYLFATFPGISKVGSYSGNGSTQTIPCGFTTGSRFVLIKRIDNSGDWFVWDTARGITPTTDPHLSLNTTAAEVTTDDSIDQDASGFVVNQNAATNINALGGNYLFLAIA